MTRIQNTSSYLFIFVIQEMRYVTRLRLSATYRDHRKLPSVHCSEGTLFFSVGSENDVSGGHPGVLVAEAFSVTFLYEGLGEIAFDTATEQSLVSIQPAASTNSAFEFRELAKH